MTDRTLADENTAEVTTAFELLSNARRRGVLYAVSSDGATTVEELAARIASWQGDDAPAPEDVHTSLVHAHLPKLDDADAVDYDPDSGTVEPTGRADDLDTYLQATSDSESMPHRTGRTPGFAD